MTFTNIKVNNCFGIYMNYTETEKINFLLSVYITKWSEIEVLRHNFDSSLLITSNIANQHAQKAPFTCVLYTT